MNSAANIPESSFRSARKSKEPEQPTPISLHLERTVMMLEIRKEATNES